ncbi:MAG: 3-isopropylmalate dehydratase large subunit [Desulfobacterales bacterium]|nr:3-isopropylmalate dehydratase large subunit [Desulfobacterales bacterium]MBF0396422.1 3-isopropylmalate dehydratase large subunit [Desulfobacterales bacterium]
MGMTITEKILAAHAGKDKVKPGEIIYAKVDVALGNDITAPIAIEEFYKSGAKKVFDKDRVILVPDHFVPNKDIKSAMQAKVLRDFAKEQNLTYFFDAGEMGVEHAILPEKGLVLPGDLVIGADSHTCTYGGISAFATGVGSTDLAAAMITGEIWLKVPETIKFIYNGKLNPWVEGKDLILYTIGDIGVDGALYCSMEFCGTAIQNLNAAGRLTIANMAIEAGAKNGIIAPDEITKAYVEKRAVRPYTFYSSDSGATYSKVIEYDVSNIEPQVSFPHSPENTKGISEIKDIFIDQVVIGSCTNGRIEDMRSAASVIKGKKAAKNLRLIIIPATPFVYKTALEEGLIKIFLDAGGIISPPTCGPCLGGHMGILAKGERAVATTNRNFVGRMGHVESEVYLANPAVAAASAILGKIGGPAEVM